jgi:transposase
MPKALYVRELTSEEREQVRAGLRSSSAFTVRRSQIILMNGEEHMTARQIGARLRCSDQCAREALRAFEQEGVGCLYAKSHRKHHLETKFSPVGLEGLAGLVHQSPRQYGYANSLWSLAQLAEVSLKEGLSSEPVSYETVRQALKRLDIDWRRARQHITSPDPHYERKKAP